jgi:hypothetical protein
MAKKTDDGIVYRIKNGKERLKNRADWEKSIREAKIRFGL